MKIAIFLPNWVGDAVMATPALRAIRKRYAAAEITGIMRPIVADTLAGLDVIDYELLHDPRSKDRQLRSLSVIRSMRKQKFDLAVLLPNSLRSGWMSYFGNAKQRTGIIRDGRGIFLNDGIPRRKSKEPYPALNEYLRIAEHLECDISNRNTELELFTDDAPNLQQFWNRHPHLNSDGPVVFNAGGAFGAAKHWGVEAFAQLASKVAAELQKTVLVVCGPAERFEAKQIAALSGHPHVISLADEPLSVGLTKAAVASASLLVTTDSGPRHFAQPFDVPVVTLFGPTHIEWSETFYDLGRHVQLDVDCGPCQQRVCPLGHHRCMRDLTPDRVMQEIRVLQASLSVSETNRKAA